MTGSGKQNESSSSTEPIQRSNSFAGASKRRWLNWKGTCLNKVIFF